jgi:uncharacterized protein
LHADSLADPPSQAERLDALEFRLLETIRSYGSCAVAFSAGVDSTLVAAAAFRALGASAVAVTGRSASLAEAEYRQACELADAIGIRHVTVDTGELSRPGYVANAGDRCYHCKTELYTNLEGLQETLGVAVIANGANVDDLGDYRPGMEAARERAVRSPLVECGFRKADVREVARRWGLPVWDKPAMPCLSSRLVYGLEVTPERLARVEAAEKFLRERGFRDVRVRHHENELARVELLVEDFPRLLDESLRQAFIARCREVGFRFVAFDLEGLRSGSMNSLVTLDS